jgi:hypothetical protein
MMTIIVQLKHLDFRDVTGPLPIAIVGYGPQLQSVYCSSDAHNSNSHDISIFL